MNDQNLLLDELDIVTIDVADVHLLEGGTSLHVNIAGPTCRWSSASVSSSHNSCTALTTN